MRSKPTNSPMAPGNDETRKLFLDAAERQFAQHGYQGAKIRAIAEAAGANLGALHYYWGSKEALFRAVCERRLRPINEERLRRYDVCVAVAAGGALDVFALIKANLEPALRVTGSTLDERKIFRLFYGRALTDPAVEVNRTMTEIFDETSRRFMRLMRQACGGLEEQEFYWRLSAYLGTIIYIQSNYRRVEHISRGAFHADRIEEAVDLIAHYLTAMMTAPDFSSRATAERPMVRRASRLKERAIATKR